MADARSIILHQYATSPFSEKVRLALRLKNLAWAKVDVPVVMPKPDLIPLTGGYRRTPVMQIGADIYCDTAAILRELEVRFQVPG
ncbi:MAG: glutathione S-transferase N-terminal domain-containing protein, partial [Pseudomonadota bacterium]